MQFEDVHLGKIIDQEIRRIGMTKAEFARRINTSRQNVNTLLKKSDLSSDLMRSISSVLGRNLFKEFSARNNQIAEELAFDSIRVRGLDLNVELQEDDMKAFLQWLSSRKRA